jgi:FkbM family methyltransferase
MWARWLAWIGGGMVYSFEPSAETFELLRINTQEVPAIEAVRMCCGAVTGDAYLSRNAASALRHVSTMGESVEMIRVDDFCASRGAPVIDFMKIDVEGSELDVLKGSVKTIQTQRPLILFEYAPETSHRFGYAFKDLTDFLERFGYEISRIPDSNNYLARALQRGDHFQVRFRAN